MVRIAINTGGGDAPGLNAVIRSVAVSALNRGWEVVGVRRGYQGMLENDPEAIIPLDRERVRGIAHLGGTILGTTNRGDPLTYPVLRDGKRVATERHGGASVGEDRARALRTGSWAGHAASSSTPTRSTPAVTWASASATNRPAPSKTASLPTRRFENLSSRQKT